MRALLIAFLLLLPAAAAVAQVDTRATQPLERSLEQAWGQRDYEQFGRILLTARDGIELLRTASWMRERVLAGDGAFMVRAYAGALWRAVGATDAATVKETVAVMAVYLNSLIVLDGLKCEDRSAVLERLQQVTAETRSVLDFMRALPDDRRAFVLETAFRIEEKLADKRGDDDWICRAGLKAMMSALKRGTPAQTVPTPPGQIGTTIQVQPDPAYEPVFRPRAEWEPEQRARRPEMRAAMRASLLERPQ